MGLLRFLYSKTIKRSMTFPVQTKNVKNFEFGDGSRVISRLATPQKTCAPLYNNRMTRRPYTTTEINYGRNVFYESNFVITLCFHKFQIILYIFNIITVFIYRFIYIIIKNCKNKTKTSESTQFGSLLNSLLSFVCLFLVKFC